MKFIPNDKTTKVKNSDNCTVYEYPFNLSGVNIAVADIQKRFPNKGFCINRECKELVHIIDGSGIIVVNREKFNVTREILF